MKNSAITSLLPVYNRIDVVFDRGEGAWLIDTKGRRYLDFGSGIAVNGLGHSHPHLVKALLEQGQKLWHVSNFFRVEQAERLADRLVANCFAETVFIGNSGAEAMEACIKMARRYWWAKGNPQRNRIITFEGGFHGRTMATISAAGSKKLTEGFEPLLEGFDHVPFGDHEALKAAVTEHTAAIMIEPIMGEGGIRSVPKVCLEGLRTLCDERGILLIFDEVQCGMGRTGTLFAHQGMGVTPDIMGLAKGLGGGFPIGACLATAEAASGMTAGAHGSTFGGNPLACAIANAVLDVTLADGFLEQVAARGEQLREGLEALAARYPDTILEVRGRGLLMGIKVAAPNAEVMGRLRDLGLIVITAADNVIRLIPPLIITASEIEQGLSIIAEASRARAA